MERMGKGRLIGKRFIAAIFLSFLAGLPFDGIFQSLVIAWLAFSISMIGIAVEMMRKSIFEEKSNEKL
jgi:hypothetical protein